MLRKGDRVKARPNTEVARKGNPLGTVAEDQVMSELTPVLVKLDKKGELVYIHPWNLEYVDVQDA